MKNYYSFLALFGLVLWFIGTAHGGYQDVAQSNFEKFTDIVGFLLVIWGVIGDITSNLTIVKSTEIRTKSINIE